MNVMDLNLFRILIDGGLVVLIWIVQLVIYPGFCYYSEAEIKRWHRRYSVRISIIVLPLMVCQLALYAFHASIHPGGVSIGMLLLVLVMWLITFLCAVPLHRAIEQVSDSSKQRRQLVQVNWYRTAGWTLLFMINLFTYET